MLWPSTATTRRRLGVELIGIAASGITGGAFSGIGGMG
jgi:hypothetical protein